MKNKDTQMIRKYLNLVESVDSKIILENKTKTPDKILSEANPLGQLVRGELKGAKIVAADLAPIVSSVINDAKIASDLSKIGVKDADTLFELMKNDFKLVAPKLGKLSDKLSSQVRGVVELNILKSSTTKKELLDISAENLVKNNIFRDKYKAYGKSSDLIDKLKQEGYSKQGAEAIAKKLDDFKQGKLQIKPKTQPSPGTTPKPPKITERLKQLPKNIKDGLMNLLRAKKGWRVIVKWAILAGVPLGVLWWFIQDYITSGGTPPEGYPQNVPQDFPPCVQDLVKNKSGEVITNVNGTVYVFVKNNEFPDGLKFYPTASNGASRVMDVKTGKKGSYKCEGQKVALQEQGTEIDLDTMADYVDTAVDDLDGYVNTGNLNSLLTILKNLKGKTFQGKNALGEFLSLYKDEEGTDFMSDVNGVGVRTIGTKGILAKRDILSLLSGGGENDPTTETTSADLSGIKITWDPASDSSDGSGSSDGSDSGKVKYTYKQDFPFPRGTSNEKIREIQQCLKLEKKYHTGNFGPITQKALILFIGDSANVKYGLTGGFNIYIEELKTKGITRELYDIVMRACGKMPITGDTATGGGTPGQVTPGTETPGQVTPGTETPGTETTPEQTPATTRETPAQLFNRFVKEEKIKGRFNGERIVYKGGDLTDGDREKLISQLDSMGFRVSREDRDYRQGDKIVFKKNETEE